jgi:hypothetical protein
MLTAQAISPPKGAIPTARPGEYYYSTENLDQYVWFLTRYTGASGDYRLVLADYYLAGWLFRRTVYYAYIQAEPQPGPSMDIIVGPISTRPMPRLELRIGPITHRK